MFLYSIVLVISRFQWPISFDIVATKSVFLYFNLGVRGYSPLPFGCAISIMSQICMEHCTWNSLTVIIIKLHSFATAECTEVLMACMFGGLEHVNSRQSYLVVSTGSRV